MSKTKPSPATKSPKLPASDQPQKPSDGESKDSSKDSVRETIESVVIAFVLAFLFRTFEAEAFVIPTGSMAPTLMGQHLDEVCPKCDFPHRIGVPEDGGIKEAYCVCPNCGYARSVVNKSYKGDRIIVSKFPYEFGDPQRWDVAVFKYPARAKTNFIKRLVGLPNETVRIEHGDLFTRPEGVETFTIARKPPDKLRAMLQVVYDNDYQAAELVEGGWPPRWQPGAPLTEGSWQATADGLQFQTSGQAAQTWLRYQHLVASRADWTDVSEGPLAPPRRAAIRPQLIGDFYAYNTGRHEIGIQGSHWVGDLAVECEVETATGAGELVLELVEGGRQFQCALDLASGQARLIIPELPAYKPRAATPVQGAGRHHLLFANADDQLFLWVNGKSVVFDQPTAYTALAFQPPDAQDLSPVGIAARHAQLSVRHLRVLRDVYYIADRFDSEASDVPISDYTVRLPPEVDGVPLHLQPRNLQAIQLPQSRGPVDFTLGDGEYLALGDNSPRSKDSRLWAPPEYYVRRELLIGKALFIYWPHAWAPDWAISVPFPVAGDVDLPFYPNFKRMRFVR